MFRMINAVALTFPDMKLESDYRSQLRTKISQRSRIHRSLFVILCLLGVAFIRRVVLGGGIHSNVINLLLQPASPFVTAYLLYLILSRCIPTRYSEFAVWATQCLVSCFTILANPFRVSSEPSLSPAMKSLLHRCGPDVTENYIDFFRLTVLLMIQIVVMCNFRLRIQFVVSWAVVVCPLVSAMRVLMPIDDIGLHRDNVFFTYATTVCVIIVSYVLESTDRGAFLEAANAKLVLAAGFPGRLRICEGNIISQEGLFDLFEAPINSLNDFMTQQIRDGMQTASGLLEVTKEVLHSGITAERTFYFQPENGPNRGQKVFKTSVIVAREFDRKTIMIGFRVIESTINNAIQPQAQGTRGVRAPPRQGNEQETAQAVRQLTTVIGRPQEDAGSEVSQVELMPLLAQSRTIPSQDDSGSVVSLLEILTTSFSVRDMSQLPLLFTIFGIAIPNWSIRMPHIRSSKGFAWTTTPVEFHVRQDLDFDEVYVLLRNRHPQLLFFYGYTWLPAIDAFDAMPRPALVTERMWGTARDALLLGSFRCSSALQISAQVGSALEFLHGESIEHGSVRTDSVALIADPRDINGPLVAKLMNFTAAKQTSDEQLGEADLYGFGVLLHDLFVKNFGGSLLDGIDPGQFAESMDPRFATNFPELAVLLHSIGAQAGRSEGNHGCLFAPLVCVCVCVGVRGRHCIDADCCK